MRNLKTVQLKFCISGIIIHLLTAAILIIVSNQFNNRLSIHAVIHSLAALPLWIYLAFSNYSFVTINNRFIRITSFLKRSGTVISGLITMVIFAQSLITVIYKNTTNNTFSSSKTTLLVLSILSLSILFISVFFVKLSDHSEFTSLRSGTHYMLSLNIVLWLLLSDSIFNLFNLFSITQYIENSYIVFHAVLATEILIQILLLCVRPASTGHNSLPVFHSRILLILCKPEDARTTIRNFLIEIFGFDISSLALFSIVKKVIFPGILLSLLYNFLLSCIVIIQPGEDAIISFFGKIKITGLHSGIHIKAPYPAGNVIKYDKELIRRIHVGSHQPQPPDGEVFKKDVPLLWTTIHSYNNEEMLLISSPKQLVQNARESGGKIDITNNKTPSVSLAGADIVVDYKILDVYKFSFYNVNPEKYLKIICQSEVTRAVLKYDIDTLLSDARSGLISLLKIRIQSKCDSAELGIQIISIGISAVHPPTEIADVFEENVSALQDRETKIQQAMQSVLRIQIETAGSADAFTRLVDQIENEENLPGIKNGNTEQMILNCGGKVSKIMSDALAYRWNKEYVERGKSDKFTQEQSLHKSAGNVYSYHRYLSILEEALSIKKKIVISDTLKNLIADMNSGAGRILDTKDF